MNLVSSKSKNAADAAVVKWENKKMEKWIRETERGGRPCINDTGFRGPTQQYNWDQRQQISLFILRRAKGGEVGVVSQFKVAPSHLGGVDVDGV